MDMNLKKIFKYCWYCVYKPFNWIKNKITRFYRKLSRSCKWFLRMWNNHDWDYTYFIEMMVDKMKDMRYQFDVVDKDFVDMRHQPTKVFSKPEDSDYEEVDNLIGLDKAIELGERILNHDYLQYTPEVEKWFSEHRGLYFNEKMPEDIHKQFIDCCKESEENEQQDINEFFNIIRDEHQKWWT